jgi:hypothetical protein
VIHIGTVHDQRLGTAKYQSVRFSISPKKIEILFLNNLFVGYF